MERLYLIKGIHPDELTQEVERLLERDYEVAIFTSHVDCFEISLYTKNQVNECGYCNQGEIITGVGALHQFIEDVKQGLI